MNPNWYWGGKIAPMSENRNGKVWESYQKEDEGDGQGLECGGTKNRGIEAR